MFATLHLHNYILPVSYMYYKNVYIYLNQINYITFLIYNGYVGHFFREEIIKVRQVRLSFTLLIMSLI